MRGERWGEKRERENTIVEVGCLSSTVKGNGGIGAQDGGDLRVRQSAIRVS